MVRINGKWCGPGWTAGQNLDAADMKPADFKVSCKNKLDCACKRHDIDVYHGGRSRASDNRLIKAAALISLNPFISPSQRTAARFIASGMMFGRSSK